MFHLESPPAVVFHHQPISSNSLLDIHASLVSNLEEQQQPAQTISAIQEVVVYKADLCTQLMSDPLIYWKDKFKIYSILSKLASCFLCAPATSVASEQIFSVARDVYDYNRCRLSPDKQRSLFFSMRLCRRSDTIIKLVK